MPTIQSPAELCTVIVTVDAALDVMPELEAHARAGLTRFRTFAGFVGGALHKSADGRRLVQYLQWDRERDYLACVQAPEWETVSSSRRFLDLVATGHASVDVRTYAVLVAAEAARHTREAPTRQP